VQNYKFVVTREKSFQLLKAALNRISLIPIATIVMAIMFAYLRPRFATISNFQNVVFQASILALTAFGQFFPVLTGGIDFTVGGQMALASIVGSLLMVKFGLAVGIIGALLACCTVGMINGLIVVRFRTPPLVITLGMLWVITGITLMLSNGQRIYGLPKNFESMGTSQILGIPIAGVWAVLAFALCYFVLHHTIYGRYFYAVGANERTSRLSGIPVEASKVSAYIVSGLLAGSSGLVLTAALGSGQPNLGAELSIQNFVAVFIAGTRWGGGEGSIVKVIFGVFFVSTLANGLNILNVSTFTQMVISGLTLVLALSVDAIRNMRTSSS